MGKTYYIYSNVEGSDITILLLNVIEQVSRFCSHISHIYNFEVIVEKSEQYINIYISLP